MSNHDPYGQWGQPSPGAGVPTPGPGAPPPIPQYPAQQPHYPGQHQIEPGSFGAPVPPVQATPPKRRRIWPWLAIPLVFALLIGGCSLALFLAVRPPADATNDYVALLDEGDYGAAYDSLCTAVRQTIDRDTFIAQGPERVGGDITDYRFSNVNRTNGVADVSGTVSIDGVSRSVTYELVQEDGEWRVCGGGF